MSAYEPNFRHLREVLIFCFNMKKSATEAHRMLPNAYDTELTAAHIFDCPAILAALQEREKQGSSFRQQILMWTILNRLSEQLSESMVLFDLVPSWTSSSSLSLE
ncbi:hypothetical protein TNCV_1523401 [Trichonephila clavipes]|nr:hypothetical protein TNCV_1523401 [Trichonephila clavipes]